MTLLKVQEDVCRNFTLSSAKRILQEPARITSVLGSVLHQHITSHPRYLRHSVSCTRLPFPVAIRPTGQASVTVLYIVSVVFKKNTLHDSMKTNTFKVCGPWLHPFPKPPLKTTNRTVLTPQPPLTVQVNLTTATPSILHFYYYHNCYPFSRNALFVLWSCSPLLIPHSSFPII